MKLNNILLALFTIINLSLLTACSSSNKNPENTIVVNESDIVKEKIGVSGMTCVGCEVTLEENVSKIKGVVNVKASHTKEEVIIEFDSTKTDLNTITKTIKDSGYKPFSKEP